MRRSTFVVALLFGLFLLFWSVQSRRVGRGLVVYCAHDLVFAAPLLERFTEQTGIPVTIVGDTEASKSLGLVRRIAAEADAPQCDVFWNNELLGTMRLAEDGLLRPYEGEGWARMPPAFRDSDARWTGFAGRMRVTVSRTDAADGPFAIADPMFGTSLTQAAALWDIDDGNTFRRWYEQVAESDRVLIVAGNGPAMRLVRDGRAVRCWTDTDDLSAIGGDALAAGELTYSPSVDLVAVGNDIADVETDDGLSSQILIPNTVAIVEGTAQPAEAQQLVDWLLSAETEASLASGPSRQIPLGPLGPNEATSLPPLVRELAPHVGDALDLRPLLPARDAVLEFLTERAAGATRSHAAAGDR